MARTDTARRFPTVRRFAVVGEPFYRVDGITHDDVDVIEKGDYVTSDERPDSDGDLYVRRADGQGEPVSLDCLVEVDEEGYPVLPAAADERTSSLALLAVRILGGAR